MMHPSKKIKLVILLVAILMAGAFIAGFFMRPIIISIAKYQLDRLFDHNHIAIENCNIRAGELSFTGIHVTRGELYELKLGELYISYTMASLLRAKLSEVRIKDVLLRINTPDRTLADARKLIKVKGGKAGPFSIDRLEISNLRVDINTSDVIANGHISIGLSGRRQIVHRLAIGINSLQTPQVSIEEFHLQAMEEKPEGELSGKKISYGKIALRNLKGKAGLLNNVLTIDPLSASLFDGNIAGTAIIAIKDGAIYDIDTKAVNINIDKVVSDLNLSQKIGMDGLVAGTFAVKGMNTRIDKMMGSLSVTAPGGTLVIRDDKFWDSIAEKTKQPVDILKSSFKDFHYQKGTVLLSKEEAGIVFDVAMEGEKGKMAIRIVLHDITAK